MNRSLRTALIIGGIVLLALTALPLLIGGGYGWRGGGWGWGMMGGGMMGGFGGSWWMAIFMVLIPILVIWAIVALVRGTAWSGDQSYRGQSESVPEVLRKRYARGDISKQEFEEKRRDLE